jgi:hypothetical protein
MTDAVPVILQKDIPLSCFSGTIHGSVGIDILDPNTDVFPVQLTAKTNLGTGSIPIEISGNGTIRKQIFGVDVDITISNWHCDRETVTCHVNAVGTKFRVFSCTVLNEDFTIKRHNPETFANAIADFHARLETLAST